MNFKQFSTSDNQWHDIPYYQHKTATDTLTLPAVIYPNDTSITVGIKGNMSQSGTPTPTTPIQPQETGERTGNLWNNGDTWENDNTDTRAFFQLDILLYDGYTKVGNNVRIDVKSNGYKYLVSITPNTSFTRVSVKHNGLTKDLPLGSVYGEFEANVPVTISFIVNGFDPTTIGGISISNIMLNAGATPQPYEPFGYKIPILLNSQTINKYLGTEQTVRQIKKLVLTGEENITFASEDANRIVGVFTIPNMRIKTSEIGYCNILHWKNEYSQSDYNRIVAATSNVFYMSLEKSILPEQTIDGFITYLRRQYAAGTPITIWYVLETPETAVVNEPLMKIGNYADSLNTSIPCTAGENTLDVQTTVQPSEVTAEFSGWHPVQSVHERENGAWT